MANILLLEDDLSLAMHYRQSLEQASHRVFHDVSVALAKETLKEERIDLVLCDIIIRGPDGSTLPQGGLSLISHILLHIRPRPKIIAITGANPSLNLLRHADMMNADATMEKPFSVDDLLLEIERQLTGGPEPTGASTL